ncbi:MAG: hypothetical protein P3W87_006455, partial [Gammaproteobacteria bacterium]|nr:hypothetical protein [Gammaproteobacteria bacterium]
VPAKLVDVEGDGPRLRPASPLPRPGVLKATARPSQDSASPPAEAVGSPRIQAGGREDEQAFRMLTERVTSAKNMIRTVQSSQSEAQVLQQKLRTVVQKSEEEYREVTDFRREMASLRSLGRLMAAVYLRPGAASSVSDRIKALAHLAQTSRDMAEGVLQAIGETRRSGYVRAMAMEAVIDLVSRSWELAEDEASWHAAIENISATVRAAAVEPALVQASSLLAKQTWAPMSSEDEYREALVVASQNAYWRLALMEPLGPEKSRWVVDRFLSFLKDYEHPRGSTDEMRMTWTVASLGRLTTLMQNQVRRWMKTSEEASHQVLDEARISEYVREAIQGFIGIEKYAPLLITEESPHEHEQQPEQTDSHEPPSERGMDRSVD